ncbi:class I SAM-dependent methyltransferase [Aureispira anguillae]|uniref:Class I SAM-dependent methyltransferase n=1 Tax=Aureispira anguillae TaxID=2864201 RepID=A0A915VKK0_9BACT|nr:class I SAM-dependent methyltransferase [Aureispira anguillae]BDS09650.1 class I SAM-dependent methyltransferase [Aureispira anguillae]
MDSKYYKEVKAYYDIDSENFESRYWENITLQRIRNSFREESNNYKFQSVLEIGYGPGLDVIYFAEKNPDAEVFGIDISEGMHDWAKKQVALKNIQNVQLAVGSVEDIAQAFDDKKFDHIYVYFGALNTVEQIAEVQGLLKKSLKPDGKMVLTFVNKWYLMAILKPLLKLRFKTSVQRLRKTWGGYSPSKFLASKCYSYSEIKRYFNEFEIVKKRGYSIFFPAWYENRINVKYPKLCNFLWKVDQLLQKTPFWNLGEYSLYVFKNKP